MTDLVGIMSKLVDRKGKIQVPGIYDSVDPVTQEERDSYKVFNPFSQLFKFTEKVTNIQTYFQDISFSLEEYQNDIGCNKLQSDDKTDLLMARWRFPTLSLHGIEGAYSDQGAKTVIPRKVNFLRVQLSRNIKKGL